MRLTWKVKAMLPVAGVLLLGLLLFFWVSLAMDKSHERQLVLLVAAGGAVVICAALLAALAAQVQRPLAELQEKIERLQGGDLSVRASFADRNDEIGDLGRNFNAMVEQLRAGREEIQRLHQTQMTRAEHLASLGELAAGLAHELRNPLAGIAGVIEIIGRDLPETSPSRAVWKEVQHEMQRVQRILNDLLSYARPKPPQILPSDLGSTVDHAITLARQQALSRPIEIAFEKREPLPAVEHDAAQIEQVLLNLLLNAIQAIEAAGRIEVILAARDESAVITVHDNGRGISSEQLPNIFKPFFTTKGQGTGLGLSLARRIVEGHDGRIAVSSAVKQGTTFTVTIPLRRPAMP